MEGKTTKKAKEDTVSNIPYTEEGLPKIESIFINEFLQS